MWLEKFEFFQPLSLYYIPNNFSSIFSILYFPSTSLNSTKVFSSVSSFCLKSVVKYNFSCGISTWFVMISFKCFCHVFFRLHIQILVVALY